MPGKPRIGDRVEVVGEHDAGLVGVVAVNKRHLPYPYLIDVTDGPGSDDPYYDTNYAGPFNATMLRVLPKKLDDSP